MIEPIHGQFECKVSDLDGVGLSDDGADMVISFRPRGADVDRDDRSARSRYAIPFNQAISLRNSLDKWIAARATRLAQSN